MNDADELLDVKELAKLIGLKPATVRWYAYHYPERVPPRALWASKLLWVRGEVKAWMHERATARRMAPPPQPRKSLARPMVEA